jgi:hypothetical protein
MVFLTLITVKIDMIPSDPRPTTQIKRNNQKYDVVRWLDVVEIWDWVSFANTELIKK